MTKIDYLIDKAKRELENNPEALLEIEKRIEDRHMQKNSKINKGE